MQNSLERLIASIEEFLTREVAGRAEREGDDYLRSQALSAAEVLASLRSRITWNTAVELAWVPAVRDLAREIAARKADRDPDPILALPEPEEVGPPADEIEAYVAAHLRALSAMATMGSEGSIPAEIADRVAGAVDEQANQDHPRFGVGGSERAGSDSDPRKTVGELLRESASRWPESELIVGTDRTSFADFLEATRAWGRRLLGAGIGRGDHVGILLDPRLDYLELMFGALSIGCTVVPISDRFKAAELGYVVQHADLKLIVTTDRIAEHTDFPGLLIRAFPELSSQASGDQPAKHQPARYLRLADAPQLRRLVLIGERADAPFEPVADLDRLAATVDSTAVEAASAAVLPDDPAYVMYTSGTSAEPKGCVLSHATFTLQGDAIAHHRYHLEEDNTFWCPLPLFHNGGICTLFACLSSGASYCHSGRFEAGKALDQLEREPCTHAIPTFETIWLPIVEQERFPSADLSKLRMILSAGTPERLRQLQGLFPQAVQISNYGCTEAAGHLTMAELDDPPDLRAEACGRPLPGMEVRIRDLESDAVLGPGRRGEIEFRGPMRFLEYYKDPERTREAIDADGWFRTGDLGELDEGGRIRFLGRTKDMLKVGGENVAAAEVEAFLIRHPAIRVAQVVAAPDARYAEVPAAFVEPVPGAELSEREVIDYCLDEIATFKVPRYVRIVEEWPMSGTKIKKFVLRERIAAELEERGIEEAPPVRVDEGQGQRTGRGRAVASKREANHG